MRYLYLLLLICFCTGLSAQNALHFDGVDDHTQANGAGPTGSADRTVEAWINMSAISTTQEVILDWGDMPIGQRFTLNVINGVPRIEVGGNGISAPSALAANSWHHIAASFTSASPQIRLYVDGIQVASGNLTVTVNTSNVNGIIIGKRNDSVNYFEGKIDEVRVWNYVRTAAQIAQSKNKEICAPLTGLVAYYNFNQGVAGGVNTSVTTLTDLSGNNNNANLYNFGLAGGVSNWVSGQTLTLGSSSTISPVACQSYTTPSGSNTYTTSGTYTDTLVNSNGCDSVITIQLTVNTVDTSVTQNGNVLTSNAVGATYQWIDCNNGNQNIPGQTNATFTALFNGSYSVSVTQNGCTAVSPCHPVTNVSIGESNEFPFSVYPNPLHDEMFINIPETVTGKPVHLRIMDATGHSVFNSELSNTGKVAVDMKHFAPGFYTLELAVSSTTFRTKVVKF